MLLHDQRSGNTVKFINRYGSETADKGDGFHLPDECVGVIFEANGDVTEVFVTPSLINDGMSFS